MASFVDACRFTPTLGGTTDWTYSSAVTGYQSPAAAGMVNGQPYRVRAESADLTQWEISTGIYNSSTGVIPRTTVLYNSSGTGTATGQSGAGTKINFTTVPQVAVVALAEDLANLGTSNTFTAATGFADGSTLNSSGLGSLKALGVNETVPSTGNVNISGQYEISGTQIASSNLGDVTFGGSFTPTWGGFSSPPTGGGAFYLKIGKLCLVYINGFSGGTSNSTTKTITLPFTPARSVVMAGVGNPMDNSAWQTVPCRFDAIAGTTTANVYKDVSATNNWTASGICLFNFAMVYETT
jgi:hypothetical protein